MAAVLNETELKYCADNIELCCTVDLCYDVIIVCTGNASQEKYWQERLEKGWESWGFEPTTPILVKFT